MTPWWGKKSSKSKEQQQNLYSSKVSDKNNTGISEKKKSGSFDNVSSVVSNKGSPRISRDINNGGSGSSGFSGFDSDRKALPLPLPSMSSLGIDQTVGLGSGSGSVSSVSSSGSSDYQTQTGISSTMRFHHVAEVSLVCK